VSGLFGRPEWWARDLLNDPLQGIQRLGFKCGGKVSEGCIGKGSLKWFHDVQT
jgi:hypothetical protein